MKNCKIKAKEWGLSLRTVNYLCKSRKVPGAEKIGGVWQIPDESPKPKDGRVTSGRYVKKDTSSRYAKEKDPHTVTASSMPYPPARQYYGVFRETPAEYVTRNRRLHKRKPLPIGLSDYARAQSEYYYVDKTLLIKELLDQSAVVSLFTRPRRFGKTLNMDMLRVFFEKTQDDTSAFFRNRAIWKCGEEYREKQGKYPVIYLTLKDVRYSTWEETLFEINEIIREEFDRHGELSKSDRLSDKEKEKYRKIVSGGATEAELATSIRDLSRMLAKHYGESPVILIDEYDTPIQEGYSKDFYDEIIRFMRNFFSSAFKDNKYIAYGFMTGILRISQESLFSGMNNLAVYTVLNTKFSSYFGFTPEEVKDMLAYYGVENKAEELRQWYDGYQFGGQEIYNPWSVINYISNNCEPQPYWVNTGRNEILKDVLSSAPENIEEILHALLAGDTITVRINQNVVYHSLPDDPENIFSLLLITGYLKALSGKLMPDGAWMCRVAIPNREVSCVYKNEVLLHLVRIGALESSTANRIAESLFDLNVDDLKEALEGYISTAVSFYDTSTEGFYHGLFLGLVSMMDHEYMIRSNRESGNGRYDICLIPRSHSYPGIILELKYGKNLSETKLQALAEAARKQIDEKNYDAEMRAEGAEKIIKLGVALSGKKVKIVS